jgi:DNA-binding Xre family transcriptional regulator
VRPAWSGLKRPGSNPVALGRKHCSECGHWRLVASDFGLKGDGTVKGRCRLCLRLKERQRTEARTPAQRIRRRDLARARTGWVPGNVERILLPPEPIRGAINRWLQLHLPEWRRDEGRNDMALARASGVSERGIGRIRSGKVKHVRLDVADQLAVALDIPLSLLYPYEDDEEMAA